MRSVYTIHKRSDGISLNRFWTGPKIVCNLWLTFVVFSSMVVESCLIKVTLAICEMNVVRLFTKHCSSQIWSVFAWKIFRTLSNLDWPLNTTRNWKTLQTPQTLSARPLRLAVHQAISTNPGQNVNQFGFFFICLSWSASGFKHCEIRAVVIRTKYIETKKISKFPLQVCPKLFWPDFH